MKHYMKAPLYFVLLMLVGAFIASPAIAQDEAAAEDTTSAAEDAAQATDDATQATDDAVEAADDAVEAANDAVEATEDAAQEAEDSLQPTQDSITVEWIVNEAPDDAPVNLKGRLVESLGDDEYVFEDESGTVQVEIDDALFSPDQFQSGVEVEIFGQVDKEQEETVEIEVERLDTV